MARLNFQPVVRLVENLLAEDGWSVIRTASGEWAGQLTVSRPGQNGSAMVGFGPRMRNGEVPYVIIRDLTTEGRILTTEKAPADTVALQLVHVIRETLVPEDLHHSSPRIERGLLRPQEAEEDALARHKAAHNGDRSL